MTGTRSPRGAAPRGYADVEHLSNTEGGGNLDVGRVGMDRCGPGEPERGFIYKGGTRTHAQGTDPRVALGA